MGKQTPVVLIIDDEVQIRRFLRAGFELESFTVREAPTAGDGIRSATLKPADLVVLDLGLPDMDGAVVVERLRSWSQVPSSSSPFAQMRTRRCACWSSAPTTTW